MNKLIIFSGAGLSAESGIQTFRGTDGMWNEHKIEEICDYSTWKSNFNKVHEFYNGRRVELGKVEPNSAHSAIVEWQKRYDTVVMTQNIDNLLERAGCQDVVHLHGFLTSMHCTACGHKWDVGYEPWDVASHRCARKRCNSARGVKPDVVFFHEQAPQYAVLHKVIRELDKTDIVVVMGTSCKVVPMDYFLHRSPAFTILNNLQPETGMSVGEKAFRHVIHAPATQGVHEIDRMIRGIWGS